MAAVLLVLCGAGLSGGCGDAHAATTDVRKQQPTVPGGSDADTPASAQLPATPVIDDGKAGTASARRGPLKENIQATASFSAARTVRIGTLVPGRIKEMKVDVGARVHAGQTVAVLDAVFLNVEAEARRADVSAAMVEQDDAKLEFDRMSNLWLKADGATPSIPKKRFDDASSRYEAAKVRVLQAGAALKLVDERIKETEIRAPFDGVVTQRFVDEGEPARDSPVTHIVEVQEASSLELEFALPQRYFPCIREGVTPLSWAVEGAPDLAGKAFIKLKYPEVLEATRAFRCRAVIGNADLRLAPGMLTYVTVEIAHVDSALTIPRAALRAAGGGWEVRVQAASGKTENRPVKTGAMTASDAEITEGIAEGDVVVLP